MSKIFIDTNILVYTCDNFEKEKQKQCRSLLKTIALDYIGVISTQVLQEFYISCVKKLKIEPLITKEILISYERFEVVQITQEVIKEAIDVSVLNKISFWDSLIVSAAQYAKCGEIWSENMNDGQIIRGIKIVNPIK